MCKVFHSDGRVVGVKNLGWLIRHASEARDIDVRGNGLNDNEASLIVTGDGWVFYSPFASRLVLLQWLTRSRSLRHLRPHIAFEQTTTLADLHRMRVQFGPLATGNFRQIFYRDSCSLSD